MARAKRRSRRRVIAYSLLLIAVAIVSWAILSSQRDNNADVNAASTSAVNNKSPLPTASPTASLAASPENSPTRSLPSPAKQSDLSANQVVARHIGRARSLYARGKYPEALIECDKALDRDPGNREAFVLKNQIKKTIAILNR